MAIEKNIVIGADLSGLEAKLSELIDALKASQTQADKTSDSIEDIADSTKDIGKSAKASKKGVEALSTGFKGMGVAIKAAGIGLLLAAMDILKELFDNNQKTVDFFNTSFNALQVAFSDFSKWISANIGGIGDFFKGIFEDPKQALIDFADAFKKNIQERFESYLDTLGYLASAVKKVFSGDFKGALEDVKSAGKETIDVFTGVNNSFDKGVELVTKAAKATAKYVVQTVKSGAAMTDMNKQAEIAEVLMQGLIEKYDLQAEKLRQVRDDERISIDERIKANEELGKVLEEQEALMLENAQKVLNAKARQLQLDEDNIEFQKEFISAQNELAGVQAQVAGFHSEQLMNEMALQREILDIENARSETEQEINELQSQVAIEQAATMRKRLDLEEELSKKSFELENQRLMNQLNTMEVSSTMYEETINALDLLDAQRFQTEEEESRKRIALEQAVQDSKVQMSMDAIGALNGLVQAFAADNEEAQKKAFMVNKAAGIASAVISTAQAVAKALAETTDPTPTQSLRFGNAAIAAATGAAQVAAIARQQFNASGTVDTNIQSNTSASTSPSFNLVGSTGTNALLQSLQNTPMKAYVVGSDVTSQQQLDRNRINQVSFP
tara:strand:+ start:2304 stop:4145 length:1842 start_codon:yes stop_codon:yes gene_type:complete